MFHIYNKKVDSIRKVVREVINELFLYKHFNERTYDRLKGISEIIFPKELHEEFNKDDRKLNDYKSFILNSIKSSVSSKLDLIKKIKGNIDNKLYIFVVAKVFIQYKNKLYTPILKSTDKPEQVNGNVWFTGIYNDIAKTLLIGKSDDDSYLMNQFKQHNSRKEDDLDDIKNYIDSGNFEENTVVKKPADYVIKINLDDLFKEKEPEKVISVEKEKTEIPAKADYRKGTKYTHPKFGTGTILSREFIETKEENGIKYRYYNVIVDFGDPYGIKTLRLRNKKPE